MERDTRGNTRRARSMGRVVSTLQTAAYIRVILMSMKSKGSEGTYGPTVKLMKVTGRVIKCMAKVCYFGRMEKVIKVVLQMTWEMDKDFSNGETAAFMRALGNKESSMESVNSLIKRASYVLENGKMAGKQGGFPDSNLVFWIL